MSLSLRDELRVVLAPDRVSLVRIGRGFTRRGLTRRVLQKKVIACADAPDGTDSWGIAVNALAAELPALDEDTAFATVILSNHFVQYAIVPWSGALRDEAEEAAYARHFFSQLYGSAAGSWELRLSMDRAGVPQLASAVDLGLTGALRGLFDGAGMKLRSIQPGLMAAFNSCRGSLQRRSAWFVLFEAGNLCLCLLQQGRLASVRTLRPGADWCETLPHLLEREQYLIDEVAHTDEVLVWAPELEPSVLPAGSGWKMHALQPAIRADLMADYDIRFAVALGG
ncbi:MAG TPA: hypothetical protein VGD24_10420 [Gallionella sp.]